MLKLKDLITEYLSGILQAGISQHGVCYQLYEWTIFLLTKEIDKVNHHGKQSLTMNHEVSM